MSEPIKYELEISNLLQIPEDRFDDFIIDLKKWHSSARKTVQVINAIADAIGQSQAQLAKMVWIDDGKHDGKVIITGPTKINP